MNASSLGHDQLGLTNNVQYSDSVLTVLLQLELHFWPSDLGK